MESRTVGGRLKGVALCREDAFDEDDGVVGGGPIVVGGGGVGDGVAAVVVGENVVERCVAVRGGRQSFREGLVFEHGDIFHYTSDHPDGLLQNVGFGNPNQWWPSQMGIGSAGVAQWNR